jgi:hypothetical protein
VTTQAALAVPAGRLRGTATLAVLIFILVTSGAGVFLDDPPIVLGRGLGALDLLRLVYLVALVVGLAHAAFRYAGKHHSFLDELSLLLLLTCGVNLVVQWTGGARSYWQGLYLVVGGLASVAFSRRLVVVMVAAVLSLEIANAFFHPGTPVTDLMRVAMLFLLAVVGFNYMERAERERAERAEDRLLRLDAGLKQLAGPEEEEAVSPLSEDGRRAQRVEHLQKLESHLTPLLVLARTGTQAADAVLLQVSADESFFWVRLGARPEDDPRAAGFRSKARSSRKCFAATGRWRSRPLGRTPVFPGFRNRRRSRRSWPRPFASGTSRPGFWSRTTNPPSISIPIAASSCAPRRSR